MVQFFSLFKKNFIFWRRGLCGCCCEIVTPILFALILMLFSRTANVLDVKGSSSIDKMVPMQPTAAQDVSGFPENYRLQKEALLLQDFNQYVMKRCNDENDPNNREGFRGGKVALGPESNPIVADLKKFFEEAYNFKTLMFQNIGELNTFTQKQGYANKKDEDGDRDVVCLGVIFDEAENQKYEYRMIYNMSANPMTHELYGLKEEQIIPFERENDDFHQRHIKNGQFYLQNLIANLILKKETSNNDAEINGEMTNVATSSYKTSDINTIFDRTGIALFVIFPLIIIFLRFVYSILYEKEYKITANLRNMGMSMYSHYFSWLLWYHIVLFVTGIFWTVLVWFSLFPNINPLFVFSLYYLPGSVLICLGLLIHGFFTQAKPGVIASLVVFFFLYAINIGAGSASEASEIVITLFALSPIAGVEKAAQIFLLAESNFQTFSFSLMFNQFNNFRYISFVIICLVESLIFMLLGMYIDQVYPSEFGARKHPLFCFGVRGSAAKSPTPQINQVSSQDSSEKKDGDLDLESLNRGNSSRQQGENTKVITNPKKKQEGFFEDIDENLLQQRKNKQSLEIVNLKKVYSNGKVAVDGLNLSMFSDQIFALLGHNGAGKTTTISMVSGLLAPTSGSISVLGKDSYRDTDTIKSFLGVCPQTNPIYPQLTVYEHLKLYSSLKSSTHSTKLTSKEVELEIEEILADIDLLDKKNYTAGYLSGGQKRKLCVALAFIGQSKVILLDEPTSGMDTYARRQLWEMLKKYKKDRIIILSTHYMDEADFLGDRIGIMGNGKLLTCGSSLFLKNNYGIGYNLTIVKEDAEFPSKDITDIVKKHVPNGTLDGDISRELKYVLPTGDSPKFEEMFKDLEDNKKKLGISNFGISLSTLEEVFLKVAVNVGDQEQAQNGDDIQMDEDDDVELENIRVKGAVQLFFIHFWALLVKRFIYFIRDIKGVICEIIIPIIIITLGLLITRISFISDEKIAPYSPAIFGKDVVPVIWANKNTAYDSIYDKLKLETGISLSQQSTATIQEFDQKITDEFVEYRLWSYYMRGVDTTNHKYSYSMIYNTTSPNGMHVGINEMNNAILKLATGNDEASITVIQNPLPNTLQLQALESTADGFLACFLFALAFSFLPSSLVLFIVKERESNAKYQQIVSGVSLPAYWFSNLLVDYLKYLFSAVYTFAAIMLFDVEAFNSDTEKITMVIALLALFGPAMILFTYVTSFMFKNPSAAQIFNFILNFFFGFVLMTASFIMRLFTSTRWTQRYILEYIYRIVPMYCYSFGMLSIANDTWWFTIFELDEVPGAWSEEGAIKEVIFLLLEIFVFTAIIFLIEYWSGFVATDKLKAEEEIDEEEDEDVKNERKMVLGDKEDYSIKVKSLTKHFKVSGSGQKGGVKKAVKGISFGVKKGDCFGLLGTNGAGKTTTFKILSGEMQSTSGSASINRLSVSKDQKKIRSLIGYCPQFDALLDRMTSREHLNLYAAIKGIPSHMRKKLIDKKIHQLNLKRYENVQAGTYSGGNKRKLSVAMALLGNPPIVFLDEPSSGMDPEARRFMWSIVSKISSKNKKSSVILTTHSMEEAEALSTKLAIMVEGSIKCIRSVQRIKSKFGKGFELETKLKLPSSEEINVIREKAGLPAVPENSDDKEDVVTKQQVEQALEKMGKGVLMEEITKVGTGRSIFNQIRFISHIFHLSNFTS